MKTSFRLVLEKDEHTRLQEALQLNVHEEWFHHPGK
nr:MAG: hypothetical protein BECKTC1821D_GA0114238_11781 [Candidatus Kentron sp. TC]